MTKIVLIVWLNVAGAVGPVAFWFDTMDQCRAAQAKMGQGSCMIAIKGIDYGSMLGQEDLTQ